MSKRTAVTVIPPSASNRAISIATSTAHRIFVAASDQFIVNPSAGAFEVLRLAMLAVQQVAQLATELRSARSQADELVFVEDCNAAIEHAAKQLDFLIRLRDVAPGVNAI